MKWQYRFYSTDDYNDEEIEKMMVMIGDEGVDVLYHAWAIVEDLSNYMYEQSEKVRRKERRKLLREAKKAAAKGIIIVVPKADRSGSPRVKEAAHAREAAKREKREAEKAAKQKVEEGESKQ
jgi:hypothetical protein